MRISLNLATRPFADIGPAMKRLRIAMGVLALLAIGLALGLRAFDHKAELARARDHSLDGQITRIAQERQAYENLMKEPANAQLLQQAGALNKLFDEKSFSWTLAMEDLETVLPGGVQVTTIEPIREKDGHITLKLRVAGPRDRAVDLVRNLEHSRRFLLPRITGENAEATEGPAARVNVAASASDRVNFDLLAEYNPALPGERKAAKKRAGEEDRGDGQEAVPRPMAGQGFGSNRGRPPYTGSPQINALPNRNPALLHNPANGGPR